jgi:hypothetical protein
MLVRRFPNSNYRGRCHLHRLIERFGIDAKLFGWFDEITADRPPKQAGNLSALRRTRTCQRWCKPSPYILSVDAPHGNAAFGPQVDASATEGRLPGLAT